MLVLPKIGNFSACTIEIGELVTRRRVGASLLVNSHADGTHSIPLYEGVLSRVVHLAKLVALAEHRTLAGKAAEPATMGGLSLMAWRGISPSAPGGDGLPSGRGTDLLSGPIRNRLPDTACVSSACWTPSRYLPRSGLKGVT